MNLTLIFALAAAMFAALYIYERVFKDRGSAIFVCPTRKTQLTMVRLAERNGVKPMFAIDSPGIIQRAFMSNGWIFNYVADRALLERMGNPKAAFAFKVGHPTRCAHLDVIFLINEGMTGVEILYDIDHGVPAGKLVGVKFQQGQDRFCIIYRRHFLFMGEKFGKKPPAWNWKEIKS